MHQEQGMVTLTKYLCCSKPCVWIWVQHTPDEIFSRFRYSRPWISFKINNRAYNCLCYSLFSLCTASNVCF
jgi:hypothetical protein